MVWCLGSLKLQLWGDPQSISAQAKKRVYLYGYESDGNNRIVVKNTTQKHFQFHEGWLIWWDLWTQLGGRSIHVSVEAIPCYLQVRSSTWRSASEFKAACHGIHRTCWDVVPKSPCQSGLSPCFTHMQPCSCLCWPPLLPILAGWVRPRPSAIEGGLNCCLGCKGKKKSPRTKRNLHEPKCTVSPEQWWTIPSY